MAVARSAPRIRRSGERSAGTATMVVRDFESWSRTVFANSPTSRPRSPIIPTTTTSAVVKRLIMPRSTDLPTPDPAMMPIRWPLPTVSSALIARTPTSRGLSTGLRLSGLISRPISGQLSSSRSGPPPSIGLPSASVIRPRSPSPTGTSVPSSARVTRAPTRMRAPNWWSDNRLLPLLKPISSATAGSSSSVST